MTIRDVLLKNKINIVNRIHNGDSTNNIAKDYKCNSGSIWFFLQELGVEQKYKRSVHYGEVEKNKDKIITLFHSGNSAYKIGQIFNISKSSILRKLKEWNIDTSINYKRDKTKPMLKDRYKEVIFLYNSGLSIDMIVKKIGYSNSQISQLLNKYNTTIHLINKYTLDETFFEKINTEEKAYALGWWYSDGNVMSDGKIRICIQQDDECIIQWLKKILQYNGPLYYKQPRISSPKPQVELCINRQKVAQDLIKLGCIPNKSMKLTFPTEDIVPQNLIHHFIRGYFDGDGSINNGVQIVGTLSFVKQLEKVLPCKITNIYQRYKDRQPEKSSHQLFIGRKEEIIKFYHWIYDDATIWLDRKKRKFICNSV